MKNLLILAAFLVATGLQAQMVNNGANLHISNGATLYVGMDFQNINGGTLTNNGIFEVTGNLLNSSSAILAGNGEFRLMLNLTNQATMNLGGATVTFLGNATSQLTSGGGTINTMKLNKTAANVELMDDAGIQSLLEFLADNNKLVLGEYDVTLATVSGAGSSRYIVTDGSGVAKRMVSTGGFDFPVGATTSSYDPVNVAATSGTPTVGVKAREKTYLDGETGPAINNNVIDASWTVTNETNSDDLVVTMTWTGADELPGFNAASSAAMRHGMSGWVLPATSNNSGRTASITDAAGTFSVGGEDFAPMAACAVVFVVLDDMPTSDQAWQVEDSIVSTAIIDEVNDVSNDLDVEYKAGKVIILKPGFMVVNNAEFVAVIEQCNLVPVSDPEVPVLDQAPRMDVTDEAALRIFPNPFSSNTTIDYYLPETANTRLEVISVSGELVGTLVPSIIQEKGYYRVNFTANNLAAGIYFVRLRTGETMLMDRMVYVRE